MEYFWSLFSRLWTVCRVWTTWHFGLLFFVMRENPLQNTSSCHLFLFWFLGSQNDAALAKHWTGILIYVSSHHVNKPHFNWCWKWQKISAVPKYRSVEMCTHFDIFKFSFQHICNWLTFCTGGGSQVVGGFPGGCYDNPVFVPCTSWQPEGLLCRAGVRHKHTHICLHYQQRTIFVQCGRLF